MDFGRGVPLDGIDFTLPEDPEGTRAWLSSRPQTEASRDFRVGTPLWGDRGYVGTLYPEGTPPSRFLREYGRTLSTIELNVTWYRYDPPLIRRWADQVPESFSFCPKLPGAISHEGRLRGVENELDAFVRAIREFGPRLGPCWLLLPNDLGPREFKSLEDLLLRWPDDLDLAVEFRHRDWFEEPVAREAAFTLLREHGMGAVITDVAGRRDALHMEVTAPFTLVRLGCNDLHESDLPRARDWAARCAHWLEQGLARAFVFAHQPTEPNNVPVVAELIEAFNTRTGASIAAPRPRGPAQGHLF